MRTFTDNERELFEQIVSLSPQTLLRACANFLKKIGYKKVISTKDYVVAEGEIPIVLSAHVDTVFTTPPPKTEIYYDKEKNVMWSPYGLGADDRGGVFALFYLLQKGYRPHIVFTNGEERGCLGASALAMKPCPFKDIRYIIQIDRRGSNDCVFYDQDYPEFEKYIESFGFVTASGSFTDIVVLCPAWKVAGVNLSTGYYDEHSTSETLHPNQLFSTIQKVEEMLKAENTFKWAYHPMLRPHSWNFAKGMDFPPFEDDNISMETCGHCGKVCEHSETYPVRNFVTNEIVPYCIDCLCSKVDWCAECGEPYVPEQGYEEHALCPTCKNEMEIIKNGDKRNDCERNDY